MKKYRLSTGLTTVKETPMFETDEQAWNELRVIMPNKFATLYRWELIQVNKNCYETYNDIYNAKYGPPPIGYGCPTNKLETGQTTEDGYWLPVLVGLTSDVFTKH